jgi:hypothetical protein
MVVGPWTKPFVVHLDPVGLSSTKAARSSAKKWRCEARKTFKESGFLYGVNPCTAGQAFCPKRSQAHDNKRVVKDMLTDLATLVASKLPR